MNSKHPGNILSLIFVGLYFIFLGRRRWKVLNRIRKTVTSNIATAPKGEPAEIKAKIFSFPEDLTVSPLTQTKGAAFIWVIEELVFKFRKYRWEPYSKFHSIPYLYFSDDENELAGVDLEHAEFIEDVFTTTVLVKNDISPEVTALVKANDLMIISEEFPRTYRIKEKVFLPGEEFFIHGLCTNPPIAYMHTIMGNAQVGKRASHSESDGFLEKPYLTRTKVFFRGKVYLSGKSEHEAKVRLFLISIFYLTTGLALLMWGLYLLKTVLIK